MSKYVVYQYLPAEEIEWTLQRLFPYPEDMRPKPEERYWVHVKLVPTEDVQVFPMSNPLNTVFYMELI
jgi:hypothetical protein